MAGIVSDIAEASVYNGRLIKKRFDFHRNDTEDNTYIVASGTVASATASTIVLASGAFTADNELNNYRIKVTSATGAIQYRNILLSTFSTLTCTVYTWGTIPDNTYTYEVIR